MNYDIFADEKKTEDTVVEVESKKLLDLQTEGTDTSSSREDEKDEETEETPSEETNKKDVVEVENDFPKKDLGVGGASFVDEFLRVATEDQMAMLKRGERTLAGFWNWSYSKVKAEYVKACGRVNGGVFSDVRALASEYFSDAVKEGTVVECEEYKVKAPTPPRTAEKKESKKATKRKSAKKVIVEVAQKAVEDAKKENEEDVEAEKEKTSESEKAKLEEKRRKETLKSFKEMFKGLI